MTQVQEHVARGARFRHVVFRRSGGWRSRPVDLAPCAAGDGGVSPFAHGPVPQLTPDEERFITWLFEKAGMDARAYRKETLRRRLPACLRALRAAGVEQARSRVEKDAASVAAAINAMIIGVTGFFRDGKVFDDLTYTVLPSLPRTSGRPRVWSAGCSDGEELYSVAMLLAEMEMLDGACLLGTDCRAEALARARAGRYELRALRDVPPHWQRRHFEADNDHSAGMSQPPPPARPPARRVRAPLRAAVQWRRADLTRLCEPGAWDLILCRNLAMYLRPEVAGRLWGDLEAALRPGGFLVLGKAERPVGASRLGPVAPCIYRKDHA